MISFPALLLGLLSFYFFQNGVADTHAAVGQLFEFHVFVSFGGVQ